MLCGVVGSSMTENLHESLVTRNVYRCGSILMSLLENKCRHYKIIIYNDDIDIFVFSYRKPSISIFGDCSITNFLLMMP